MADSTQPSTPEDSATSVINDDLPRLTPDEIELSVHAPVFKVGMLDRESHHLKRWERRWFMLRRGVLLYHKERPPTLTDALLYPTASIPLVGYRVGHVQPEKRDPNHPYTFTLEHTHSKQSKNALRAYTFHAATLAIRNEWIRALEEAIRLVDALATGGPEASALDPANNSASFRVGMLWRESEHWKRWEQRWYMLKNGALYIHKQEPKTMEHAVQGASTTISLAHYRVVRVKRSGRPFAFTLMPLNPTAGLRKYTLDPSDAIQASAWMRGLDAAAQSARASAAGASTGARSGSVKDLLPARPSDPSDRSDRSEPSVSINSSVSSDSVLSLSASQISEQKTRQPTASTISTSLVRGLRAQLSEGGVAVSLGVSSHGTVPEAYRKVLSKTLATRNQQSHFPDLMLHRAVFRGDTDLFERLLSFIVERNKSDSTFSARLTELRLAVNSTDAHGNTPLHIACMKGHNSMISRLLDARADPTLQNNAGWTPLAEAVSLGDRSVIRQLYLVHRRRLKQSALRNAPSALKLLSIMDDFKIDMEWEFSSWLPMVSRVCPSDTYHIWKKGSQVRVDTTLTDFNRFSWKRGHLSFIFSISEKDTASAKVKEYTKSRGDAKGSAEMADMHVRDIVEYKLVCWDHEKKTYTVLHPRADKASETSAESTAEEERKAKTEEKEKRISADIELMCSTELNHPMLPPDVKFTSVASKPETCVGKYDCRLYSVDGVKMSVVKRREHLTAGDIKHNKEFVESLRNPSVLTGLVNELNEEEKSSTSVSGSSNSGSKASGSPASTTGHPKRLQQLLAASPLVARANAQKAGSVVAPGRPPLARPAPCPVAEEEYFSEELQRHFAQPAYLGRPQILKRKEKEFAPVVAMSEKFPLDRDVLRSLLDLLSSLSSQGHVGVLKELIHQKLPPGFPVQVSLPVFPTMSARVSFLDYVSQELDDSLFELPAGYTEDPDRFDLLMGDAQSTQQRKEEQLL